MWASVCIVFMLLSRASYIKICKINTKKLYAERPYLSCYEAGTAYHVFGEINNKLVIVELATRDKMGLEHCIHLL